MRFVSLSTAVSISMMGGLAGFSSSSRGGDFVSAVPNYNQGTFATVGGATYTTIASALGKPAPIVGAGSGFDGVLSPFNSHFEVDDLIAFGLGGDITLRFPSAIPVTGTPQIGIITNATFVDANYPNGATGGTTTTSAMDEFGAERTAIVEVAKSGGDFVSLGRIVIDDPANYYANATNPYQFPAPDPATLASFDQPFAGSPSDFDNKDFAGVLGVLNGSAGGTWLTIPLALGLDEVQFVRLSDPKWKMPTGLLVDTRPSLYFPNFNKPADLFIDGAVLIPEPGGIALIVLTIPLLRRRSR
ncbi:MAG: hypothetical protein H7Z14_15740 [Anaerolineae bacterium]|nr:hypothetical protein [Phycisphaerae bacterium]